MLKFTIFLRRNPKLTREEFASHWDRHAALFTSLSTVKSHVRRYARVLSQDLQLPGLPALNFDGAVELWFDDLNGLGSLMGSEEYLNVIRSDEERFIDHSRCEFLLGKEMAPVPS